MVINPSLLNEPDNFRLIDGAGLSTNAFHDLGERRFLGLPLDRKTVLNQLFGIVPGAYSHALCLREKLRDASSG